MLNDWVKKQKQNSTPYQITRLTLLMGKAFGRSLRKSEIDLTPEQLQVLGLLAEKGDCAMQKIADELVVDNSAITRIIDTLEKKQFVKRSASKEDRRVRLVGITQKGKVEGIKTLKLTRIHKESLIEGVATEHLEIFIRVLDRMRMNMECFIEKEEKELNKSINKK